MTRIQLGKRPQCSYWPPQQSSLHVMDCARQNCRPQCGARSYNNSGQAPGASASQLHTHTRPACTDTHGNAGQGAYRSGYLPIRCTAMPSAWSTAALTANLGSDTPAAAARSAHCLAASFKAAGAGCHASGPCRYTQCMVRAVSMMVCPVAPGSVAGAAMGQCASLASDRNKSNSILCCVDVEPEAAWVVVLAAAQGIPWPQGAPCIPCPTCLRAP